MSVRIKLLRPDDLLNLQIDAINLKVDAGDKNSPILVIDDLKQPAFLIVQFPPQTIAEGAYYEASVVKPDANPSPLPQDPDQTAHTLTEPHVMPGQTAVGQLTVAQFAHPSRLVFKIPPDKKIPYTTEGLLDWSSLELNLNPIAAAGQNPTSAQIAKLPAIGQPGPLETALELPYRLWISPDSGVKWSHRLKPFTNQGRSELWHTRLQSKTGADPELTRTNTAPFRAIWSEDFDPQNPLAVPHMPDPELGRTAISPSDRSQIVVLTSAFKGFTADYPGIFFVSSGSAFSAIATNAKLLASAPSLNKISTAGSIALSGALTNGISVNVSDALISIRKRFQPTVTLPYVPVPFNVEQLMMTSLGGWLKSRGKWDPLPRVAPPQVRTRPDISKLLIDVQATIAQAPGTVGVLVPAQPVPVGTALTTALITNDSFRNAANRVIDSQQSKGSSGQLDLSEWVHSAAQGRDHYVRIVYEGELWPFRNKAALIKITERKFIEHDGIVEAHLVQRQFIVVRQPEVQFSSDHRAMPFVSVRLTTLVTPDIADPDTPGNHIVGTDRSFWVQVITETGAPDYFRFHGVGRDSEENPVDFTAPLIFVSISDVAVALSKLAVSREYNSQSNIPRRSILIPGQKIQFTRPRKIPRPPGTPPFADNSKLLTQALNLVIDSAGNPPSLLKADVVLPQVKELLQTDAVTTIRYYKKYIDSSLDDAVNKTGSFAEIVKDNLANYLPDNPFAGLDPDTLGVNFSANKAGGLATPGYGISTLTGQLGPLAGKAEDALADAFNPADFFPGGIAKLFGSFDLLELLPISTHGKNAPKITTTTEDIPGGKNVVIKLDWKPEVMSLPLGIAAFIKDHRSEGRMENTVLDINGKLTKPLKLADPLKTDDAKFEFNGKLTDFQVVILSSVFINFLEFGFASQTGSKTGVTVKLATDKAVEFGGDLKFIEEIRNAIPPGLFGAGSSLELTDDPGIRAGFAFALPPIAVGVFALKDVSLSAALTLPFITGKPVFDFAISQREHPFQLTVSFFGGGGFFHLQLDTEGMRQLEASLEFGAAASIDIGVASGEVHIMAGIYFSLQRKEGETDLSCTLTGYVRLGGSLSVLGIIKLSLEFNLSFTYKSKPNQSGIAYGRATLTVHVEVLFFSASVELTVEKQFGGSDGDPKFLDTFNTQDTWSEYALAFA